MKKTQIWRRLFLLFVILTALPFGAAPANAMISVIPTLVVIEGRDRFAEITLINTSDETVTYDIEWRFMRMNDGEDPKLGTSTYVPAESSLTDFDLSQHIVFTPRRVTLPPREAQKVRLSLRLGGEPPPPGDYRAHLSFRKAKDPAAESPLPQLPPSPDGKPRGFSTRVGVGVSVSIPVIYRVGEDDAEAQIGDIALDYNQNSERIEARIPITRSDSPFGALGHLKVFYSPPGGPETLVGEVRNANIFPEINDRLFTMPLKVESLTGGNLRVSYQYFDEQKKKPAYNEKTFPVGP